MPSLSITPKYDPGPEIGIATPMRSTRSCAAAAVAARTMAPASASLLARFITPPPMGAANVPLRAAADEDTARLDAHARRAVRWRRRLSRTAGHGDRAFLHRQR